MLILFVLAAYAGSIGKKIDFARPDFDSLFEFVIYDTLKKIPLSSFDLICHANDVLKKNFLEVDDFIQALKKYRVRPE